jgi:hypothetical protein
VELALGERWFFEGQRQVGRVSVVSLAASGSVVRAREFGLAEPAFGQLAHRPDCFGSGLASLGDLDGDGTAELAVTAGVAIGLIWIVSLDALGAPVRVSRVLGADAALPAPLALAALGDLDGDGVMDLAASAPAKWGSGEPGMLAVFLLERDGSVRRRFALPVDPRRGTTFGTALAGPGDWDGDGVPDLAVGAPHGTSCVVLLGRDGSVKAEYELATGVGSLPEDSGFGCALAVRPASVGRRLLVAGYGAKEPGPRKWKSLRCYPALWGFGP